MTREDLVHLYNYFSPIYTVVLPVSPWCYHGLNPGSSRCSHGVTRPYTVSPRSVKDMPRCRPGLVPVCHGSARCDHGSPRYGHSSPRFSLGLSRSVGTVFGFNVLFPIKAV